MTTPATRLFRTPLPRSLAKLSLGLGLCAAMMCFAPSGVEAQTRPAVKAAEGGARLHRMRVSANKSQTIRLDAAFTDVLVGSSEIADVIPLSDQTLYVLGKKIGTTNVSILDSARRVVGVVDVEVAPDAAALSDKLAAGVGGGIRARTAGDQLVLEGVAPDAVAADQAVQMARAVSPNGVINATRVASPQQVMLKVRFIELNRSAGRELGVRWLYRGTPNKYGVGNVGITGGRRSPDDEKNGNFPPIIPSAPFASVLLQFANNSRLLDLQIDALEEKGLARRLAEPNLVAMSGGSANFLAGGKIPIVTPQQSGGIGSTVFTTTYQEFGVRLGFQPIVLGNGLINMTIAPEVSDIDPTLAVPVGNGLSVPGLTVRSASTQLELRDGQSFAMAGLIQAVNERSVDQLPWIGSIPILGALFRSTAFNQRETELVVIVTPYLVKPTRPGDKLETPLDRSLPSNDLELFAGGQLEIPKERLDYIRTKGAALGPYGHVLPGPAAQPAVRRGVVR